MKKITLFIIFILCFICQSYAQTKPTIDRSQFKISAEKAEFSENGGNKTFTVTSDNDWSIKSEPASWASLSKKGNTLQLNVYKNNSTKQRTTTFAITSVGKTINVKISQSGNMTLAGPVNSDLPQKKEQEKEQLNPTFSISSTSASFGPNGGTTTFSVNSTNSWLIKTTPAQWAHLSKDGNTLTLRVDANKRIEPQNSYFIIGSGYQSIRVNITQSGASPVFEISSTSVNFSSNGGFETFSVTSSYPWEIETKATYGNLSIDGNQLVLKYDANSMASPRADFFTIKSGEKKIRVNISQSAAAPFLNVNGSSDRISMSFNEYGLKKYIKVSTNLESYDIWGLPSWCKITDRTSKGFYLSCDINHSSKYRNDYLEVRTSRHTVRINISQACDTKKYWRRKNGGWVNMAIGFEGGYDISGGSWYANSVIGLRIGNYKDLFQFELGVAPGLILINDYYTSTEFHLPVYASLKISSRSGKFYWKIGGTYNIIHDDVYEGTYSLRTGFGSAWKHFEWDWAYIQFINATDYDYELKNRFNIMVGMRMAWYITR